MNEAFRLPPPWLEDETSEIPAARTTPTDALRDGGPGSSVQSGVVADVLSRAYAVSAQELQGEERCEPSVAFRPTNPCPAFVYRHEARQVSVRARQAVRAASLFDLYQDLSRRRSRPSIGRFGAGVTMVLGAREAADRGNGLIMASAGSGKSAMAKSFVVGLWSLLRGETVLLSMNDFDGLSNNMEFLRIEEARSGSEGASWQRTVYLLGRVIGLTRAQARNVKGLLLALVGLRSVAIRGHRDRLAQLGSRGLVYLRTALTSASTRNAPPRDAVVRMLGKTGSRSLPPMYRTA
ncbi:hypothetical protein [Streptomyces regalis]|uniref:hypothetical protein n=1 Tax=Streptomyces regalis TaxID=68262 RepID=UPI00131C396E|nr:hypothetical protein [Streptomyces regalis]